MTRRKRKGGGRERGVERRGRPLITNRGERHTRLAPRTRAHSAERAAADARPRKNRSIRQTLTNSQTRRQRHENGDKRLQPVEADARLARARSARPESFQLGNTSSLNCWPTGPPRSDLRAARLARKVCKSGVISDVKGCSALSLFRRRGTHLSLRARKSGSVVHV